MPHVQAIELIQDERDQLEHLAKHAKHYEKGNVSQNHIVVVQGKNSERNCRITWSKGRNNCTHRRNWRHHKIEGFRGKRSWTSNEYYSCTSGHRFYRGIDSDTLNPEQIRQAII